MDLASATAVIKEKATTGTPPAAKIKFDLGDGQLIILDGTASPAEVHNQDIDADCTVHVSPEVFEDILAGNQNAQMAFMAGKLRIEGDMGIAMQLASVL